MADYTTQTSGGGRWIIFAGLAVAGLILIVALASGPTTPVDPGATPTDAGDAAPALPDAGGEAPVATD